MHWSLLPNFGSQWKRKLWCQPNKSNSAYHQKPHSNLLKTSLTHCLTKRSRRKKVEMLKSRHSLKMTLLRTWVKVLRVFFKPKWVISLLKCLRDLCKIILYSHIAQYWMTTNKSRWKKANFLMNGQQESKLSYKEYDLIKFIN